MKACVRAEQASAGSRFAIDQSQQFHGFRRDHRYRAFRQAITLNGEPLNLVLALNVKMRRPRGTAHDVDEFRVVLCAVSFFVKAP